MEEKLDAHCRQQVGDMLEIKGVMKETNNKMEEFIKSADARYADKETEKIVKGLGWMVLAAFVASLIYLIGWR